MCIFGKSKNFFVKHLCLIPPPYGGVTVYVKRLSLSLCKRGLFSGAFTKTNTVGVPEEYKICFDNWFPKHLHSYWALLEMPKLLRVLSKYKLVHSHYGLSTSFTQWMVLKVLRTPVVWTIHNQMIDREFMSTNKLDRVCYKWLVNDPKVQIVAVNEIEKRELESLGYKYANPILVIPAYIPPVEIGMPSDYLDSNLVDFINTESPKILFYAESFAKYGEREIYGTRTIIDLFIELKQILANLRLVFCIANGKSDNGQLEALHQMIKQNGYEEDVYWQVGAVSEMWPLLKACTVLVRPTCTDGDSVMVREALAFGLPVVTSDVTSRPDGCTIYHFGDMDELTERTSELLIHPIRKTYSQVDYSEIMLNVYNKLLQTK